MSSESFQAPSLEYLGQHLPQYAFESFIAQGGMGAVYKATQLSLDRDVAIKVLPHELGEDEEFRESFAKEAKAMARLNHPNLIGVFDSGTVDGMPYIVMEYIEGSSLHDACHLQKLESAQAVAIVKGICLGLVDAHEHGIIHRDIKPANILLTSRAEPKIGDFGLAHPSDSEESGLVMGTPGYTAPEIFIDPNQAGVLADQYSVGMILHQLITGIDPAGTEGPPTLPSGNIRLDAIWRKATQLNPAERYPSMDAMAAELEKWESVKSGRPVTGGALGTPVPTISPVTLSSKKSGGGIFVKMIVVAALLAGAWFALQKIQDADNPIIDGDGTTTHLPGQPDNPELPPPGPKPPKPQKPKPTPTNPGTSDPTRTEPPEVVTQPKPPERPEPVKPEPRIPEVPNKPAPKPVILPGDPELRDKAAALISDARKKRNALLGKNAKAFIRILDGEIATSSSSVAGRYKKVRRQCESGWIPEPEDMPEMEPTVSRAYKTVHAEQLSITSKYKTELTRIRDFYVPILTKAANATSDPELKKRLEAQANRAAHVESWAELLVPENEQASISLDAPIVDQAQININAPAGRDAFVGRWEVTSDNFTIYNCKQDGTFEVEGRGWTGSWEKQRDGSIRVQMANKEPHFLKRIGDAWEAPSGRDKVIRFVSVDSPQSITKREAGTASGEGHASKFVGKWDSHTNIIMRWEAARDGSITIRDQHGSKKGWSGTWKALPDDVIWVQIATKLPQEFVRDGNGWRDSKKSNQTLTPGNW